MNTAGLSRAPAAPVRTLLLSSSAARSCPVKTQHAFDPTAVLSPPAAAATEPAAVAPHFLRARVAEAQLLEALIEAAPGLVVDLRLLAEDPAASTEACLQAMTVGAAVIVGGTLPPDREGHRTGRPDVLLRGADSAAGRPTYHPVEVKGHKVLLRSRRPAAEEAPPPPRIRVTPLHSPRPVQFHVLEGLTFRLRSREGDLLQVAHYLRMLQAAGFAAEQPLAAVVGTDSVVEGAPALVWMDLAEPMIRTFSRSAEQGWRLRSILERYDYEHALRLDIAAVAAQQTGSPDDPALMVQPVVHDECASCPWWQRCRTWLADDDVGLRIDKGALDVREILALRRLGCGTVATLAAADPDQLLPSYLPLVTHRDGTEARLRVAHRRARMMRDGVAFDRETTGPIEVPAAHVEVDLDIESSADGRIYLWGFLVHDTTGSEPPYYHQFSAFDDLDDSAEAALAAAAFGWLRDLAAASPTLLVYHYSGYEPFAIRTLAERAGDPTLDWATGYADEYFVDLYDVVKTHFFGVNGLGLKPIAQHTGFRWRDDDPGGLNSQRWFAEAVHHPEPSVRQQARTRVLQYNEDDVRATYELRAWLRSR